MSRLELCSTDQELIKAAKNVRLDLLARGKFRRKPLGSQFLRLIVSERDALTLVLKAHLFVERFLEEILRRKFPGSEVLFEEPSLSFRDKARVLRAKNYLDEHLFKDVILLNRLRNSYAHRLNYDIGEFDVSRFYYCDILYEKVATSTPIARRHVNLCFLALVLYELLMRLTRRHSFIAEIARTQT